jgi:pectinesterase
MSFVGALSGAGYAGEKTLLLKVLNPAALERNDEIVSVRLTDLKKRHATINASLVAVVDQATGKEVLSQCTSGELLFRASFKPRETKSFIIRAGGAVRAKAPSLVDGRFAEPRQDYAWENDRIAYRIYGPALASESNNGIDVWTKRVRYLIVEKWYKGEEATGEANVSYHTDHGEGADFFTVGRSLGCGGAGLWYDGSVHQPGVFSTYKTLANGPLRTSFEVYYDTWDVGGKKLRETRRISLDAGDNLNRIEVTFTGTSAADTLDIVCGLVKRKNTAITRNEQNAWMGLWGQTNDDAENGFLGTGVVMDRKAYVGMKEDNDQYLIGARLPAGATLTYFAGAGWTRSGDFSTAQDWNNYLDNFSRKLQSPLAVTVQEK